DKELTPNEQWMKRRWMVRVPGNDTIVGPVSLDQIRRGLAHGKLEAGAEVAREGNDDFLLAQEVLDANAHLAPPDEEDADGNKVPPPPPSSMAMSRPPPPPDAKGARAK